MSKKENLNIVGMTCVNCSNAIERVTRKIDGVESVNVSFTAGLGEFIVRNEATLEAVKAKITKLGYEIAVNYEELEAKKARNLKNMLFKFVLAVILACLIMLIEMKSNLNFATKAVICAILGAVVLGYCGKSFFYHAYGSLKNKNYDMNVLVCLGSSMAYFYSLISAIWVYLKGGNEWANLYFSSSSMIIAFILLGKYLEERSKLKANDYIKKLIDLSPKKALLIENDGTSKEILASELKPGDKVLVKNGSQIPGDGIIIEGGAEIDTSLITGESLAVYKSVGDTVNAGCMNINGVIYVKITKFSHQSVLAEIKNLLSEAESKKMPISRFADKIANIFVPSVIAIAICVFLIWAFFGKPQIGLLSAICVLIISCPCALGLATPIAIVCAISNAAKNGVLVKNPEVLEILKDIKTIVFDKTGTLSKGEISVNFTNLNDDDLSAIASVETLSEHPISRAIVKFANEKNLKFSKFEGDFESIVGRGIVAKNDKFEILIGNKELLDENGVKFEISQDIAEFLADGFGVVFVAIGGEFKGFFALSDILRDEAIECIKTLKNKGIQTVMLTGDNAKTANFIAQKLGIDEVKSEVLPTDKHEFIANLMKNEKVLFVGDGINDAPSLKTADVGVAMNSGSDIAKGAGDIIFIKNDLRNLPYLLNLSHGTMKTIKQNLFWAFFYNLICIPVAAGILYPLWGVLLKPMFGAAAMCFSSVTVVLNSIRLKFARI
ncbi:MAG: cation-translocating P-type ATPase [Campylobacter sp.]|nr:cation-translocating P-type ATPase [Campylobacter sp.]